MNKRKERNLVGNSETAIKRRHCKCVMESELLTSNMKKTNRIMYLLNNKCKIEEIWIYVKSVRKKKIIRKKKKELWE